MAYIKEKKPLSFTCTWKYLQMKWYDVQNCFSYLSDGELRKEGRTLRVVWGASLDTEL